MHTAFIKESAIIPASTSAVYNVLADYRIGHLAVLPKPYFVDMRVIKGGFGAGTVVEVDMDVYGTKRSMTGTAKGTNKHTRLRFSKAFRSDYATSSGD